MIFRLKPVSEQACKNTGGLALFLVAVLLTALAPDARAQSQDGLQVILDRMGRLEKDIRNLNLSLARGRPAPAPATAPASAGGAPAPSPAQSAALVGPGGTHALTRLSVRMTDLESDLRTVTGTVEEFNFQARNIANRLDKLVADVDYRLGLLEGRASGASPQASSNPAGPPRISPAPAPPSVQKIIPGEGGSFASQPSLLGTVAKSAVDAIEAKGDGTAKPALAAAARPAASPTGRPAPVVAPQAAPAAQAATAPSILPQGTPQEQYNFAFGLLRQAEYDNAELALQEFVKRYPEEKLTSNARYWLGETYYVRAAYVQAAEIFLEGYQADPKGPKAPDSLLKLGMSLAGLDKKTDACAAFEKVSKDFPDASAGIRNTIVREKQKNSCP